MRLGAGDAGIRVIGVLWLVAALSFLVAAIVPELQHVTVPAEV
jgi:hypothetical protein